MKQFTNIIIFTLVTLTVNAQNGIFIPKGANATFFGDSATAFANIQNNGNLTINSSAVVNFEGQNWTNDAKAQMNGDGTVRFTSNATEAQQIDGGYNAAIRQGAAFGTLEVANKGGVEIKNSNAKVRNELKLKNKVTVNDNILVVGNNNAGKITGANENNYIVTNNKDGYLLRENISNNSGKVFFPVGTDKGYTPATIAVKSANADNYYVNVVNGVGADANRSVNRTWNVGKQNNPGQDSVELTLQHLANEESQLFTQNKSKSYVAQSIAAGWDNAFPKPSLINGNSNTRTFNGTIGLVSSFTVLALKADLTTERPATSVIAPITSNRDYKLNVWPNPATDKFYVSMNGNIKVKSVIIWNIVGIKMTQQAVNGQSILEVKGLTTGTYVIGFIGENGNTIESRKVVVAGY
jgi:hypothetical protein